MISIPVGLEGSRNPKPWANNTMICADFGTLEATFGSCGVYRLRLARIRSGFSRIKGSMVSIDSCGERE